MQIKISQAKPLLLKALKAKLVPLLVGSPGMGKSQLYQQIADEHNLLLIDIRLGQCDITDLNGFPKIEGDKAGYVPMDTFPIEGDPIPEGYSGWMLLFDELTSAPPSLQAASYKIILDRKIGKYNLHKNVVVCAAGNLETDNAVVEPMSTALQSRMIHFELAVDSKEWVNWAADAGIDHRITSYINFKPGSLYTFQPDHTDKTYAAPRTWEFVNRLLKDVDLNDRNTLPLLAGTISEGVAREFLGFCRIFSNLPKIEDITSKPETTPVPEEPSILFALTGSIAHHATKDNMEPLMKFIKRMPIEFQVVCLREAIRRNKEILSTSPMKQWISSSAVSLFS